MKTLIRLALISAVIFVIGFAAMPAQALVACSGCRYTSSYTAPGTAAYSTGGFSVPGSSAYSVAGDTAYSAGSRRYDYCSQVYDPRYCVYYYYAPQSQMADASGADYYVTGGAVYK